MSAAVEFLLNQASALQIAVHLLRCDCDFVPPLSSRVAITDYAQKIAGNATRFEAWSGSILVGLVAAYCNDQETGAAYITSVSVCKEWTGQGIAVKLMNQCIEHASVSDMRHLSLDVAADNAAAIKWYEKFGFVTSKVTGASIGMNFYSKKSDKHEQ